MKTLLTAINAKYIHSNLAVYSLKAYAEQHMALNDDLSNENIGIAEYTINQQVDDILMDIYKKKPDILCFSCYLWNITYVESIIIEIHKILPETLIWVGGPEVSYHAEEFLGQHPEVTGVMKGEGEKTFLELMEYYTSKKKEKSLQDTDGISYRENSGAVINHPWRPVMDLSEVPFVYNHMEDFENKIIYYESSRGCPFSCSYCLSRLIRNCVFAILNW